MIARVAERGIELTLTDDAKTLLGNLGYDPTYGARPLRRVIQKQLIDRLALALLKGEIATGDDGAGRRARGRARAGEGRASAIGCLSRSAPPELGRAAPGGRIRLAISLDASGPDARMRAPAPSRRCARPAVRTRLALALPLLSGPSDTERTIACSTSVKGGDRSTRRPPRSRCSARSPGSQARAATSMPGEEERLGAHLTRTSRNAVDAKAPTLVEQRRPGRHIGSGVIAANGVEWPFRRSERRARSQRRTAATGDPAVVRRGQLAPKCEAGRSGLDKISSPRGSTRSCSTAT